MSMGRFCLSQVARLVDSFVDEFWAHQRSVTRYPHPSQCPEDKIPRNLLEPFLTRSS